MLDILAHRKTIGQITGDILYNAKEFDSFIQNSIAYVTQDNVHIPTFTVYETLHYAALLRVDQKYSDNERRKRIDDVMSMLALTEHQNTVVGDALIHGLSGGQLRRKCI